MLAALSLAAQRASLEPSFPVQLNIQIIADQNSIQVPLPNLNRGRGRAASQLSPLQIAQQLAASHPTLIDDSKFRGTASALVSCASMWGFYLPNPYDLNAAFELPRFAATTQRVLDLLVHDTDNADILNSIMLAISLKRRFMPKTPKLVSASMFVWAVHARCETAGPPLRPLRNWIVAAVEHASTDSLDVPTEPFHNALQQQFHMHTALSGFAYRRAAAMVIRAWMHATRKHADGLVKQQSPDGHLSIIPPSAFPPAGIQPSDSTPPNEDEYYHDELLRGLENQK